MDLKPLAKTCVYMYLGYQQCTRTSAINETTKKTVKKNMKLCHLSSRVNPILGNRSPHSAHITTHSLTQYSDYPVYFDFVAGPNCFINYIYIYSRKNHSLLSLSRKKDNVVCRISAILFRLPNVSKRCGLTMQLNLGICSPRWRSWDTCMLEQVCNAQ